MRDLAAKQDCAARARASNPAAPRNAATAQAPHGAWLRAWCAMRA